MPPPSQPDSPGSPLAVDRPHAQPEPVSEALQRWLGGDGRRTLGSLIELFQERSFAILFVLLLGVPACASCSSTG